MAEPVLLVENLRRVFGDKAAVEDLSFSVGKGEVVGLLGANGAGKTTAISIILGLMSPTSGLVRLFGMDPFQNRIAVLKRTNYASAYTDLVTSLNDGSRFCTWRGKVAIQGLKTIVMANYHVISITRSVVMTHTYNPVENRVNRVTRFQV